MLYLQRLRDLREDRDLQQADIAKLLYTTQAQYSRYERGERELPVRHLITLADFYGVSADYILGRTNKPYIVCKKCGNVIKYNSTNQNNRQN